MLRVREEIATSERDHNLVPAAREELPLMRTRLDAPVSQLLVRADVEQLGRLLVAQQPLPVQLHRLVKAREQAGPAADAPDPAVLCEHEGRADRRHDRVEDVGVEEEDASRGGEAQRDGHEAHRPVQRVGGPPPPSTRAPPVTKVNLPQRSDRNDERPCEPVVPKGELDAAGGQPKGGVRDPRRQRHGEMQRGAQEMALVPSSREAPMQLAPSWREE